MAQQTITGRVTRISGPIVHIAGMSGAGLFDVVEVGKKRILGEIIRLFDDESVVQIYEDGTGMEIGDEALSTGRPLSVLLGPGLIGTIYDGIQRPLEALYKKSGAFMAIGDRSEPLDSAKRYLWKPNAEIAEKLAAGEKIEAIPGLVLGGVSETESVFCKIMVPPGTTASEGDASSAAQSYGTLNFLKPEGEVTIDSVIATTESGFEVPVAQWWPVRKPRPQKARLSSDQPLLTGLRVIDIFFPISKGGTAAIPGGFGTGKTMTQHAIAKWCDADVIVYIGCGERGNEMTDVLTEFPHLIDPRNGRSLMERTILIANTSNMPVAAREVSIYTGITLAEFYRDMGYHVAIMADSTSRWAEALRELSGRMEEMPAEEGFPAYLPTRLAEFYERAGRVRTLCGEEGSVSVIGAVSPPGGDFSEPVTQHTRRFIRCFWALERDLANARHYPAISWTNSYSEYAIEVAPWWERVNHLWSESRQAALDLLNREQRLAEIVRLIGPDALPDDQKLILFVADIIKNGFLQQNSFDETDMYCVPEKQIKILSLIMEFYEKATECVHLGAPLLRISAHSVKEKLSRLKSEVKNDELNQIDSFGESLMASLKGIADSYARH
ncbi:MAG: V-type ATP synthase subunit A [Spirochaetaceae bacterium]|jgi:V/A-type H+-transporting ATPase subunit A|nr:V-type ATP synthase subunit A [Spirochaetaceae bacterium]GMO20811.1 MAG: V-type ATP synthase subunit A [Termitinemataceae bacterium]